MLYCTLECIWYKLDLGMYVVQTGYSGKYVVRTGYAEYIWYKLDIRNVFAAKRYSKRIWYKLHTLNEADTLDKGAIFLRFNYSFVWCTWYQLI